MAALHFAKRSVRNKCPTYRSLLCTLHCVAKSTQLHLKDFNLQACTIVGARQLTEIDPWNCANLFWISGIFYHCSRPPFLGNSVFSFALS